MFWFYMAHPGTGARLEVEAAYYRWHRGARDRSGAPLEPDDVEDVRVCAVRCGGEAVDFSPFLEALEAQAWRVATGREPWKR